MKLAMPSLWVWAARDALRRPGEALLASVAITSLVVVLGSGLLLAQGLTGTAEGVLRDAPAVVVRRVGPGGWAPMPDDALARVKAVRGVTRAVARCWGPVRWGARTLTVVSAAAMNGSASAAAGALTPPAGKAIVGPGLGLSGGDFFTVEGAATRTFEVARALEVSTGLVAHDLVIVSPTEARTLLGLAPGKASDLAVWVFHQAEMDAIGPDLVKALPFPVRLTTRRDSLGATRAQIERAAGVRVILLVPALLALALLTLAAARGQLGARRDVGLLKALGWTTADVTRLSLFRALVIGLPAVAAGWALAYALVFVWGAGWATTLMLGWTAGPSPQLTLDPTGAVLTLLEVGALVLAPWLAAVLLPALRSAVTDPEQWLRGEEA